MIVYNVDDDREVSWHQGSEDVKLLYDDSNNPFLYEKDVGIFNAYEKHTAFEFHIYDQNSDSLHMDVQKYGLDWGNRVFRGPRNKYFIGAAEIILPYNY